MIRITKNSFEAARNTDLDKSKLMPNAYVEAHNVDLIGDGNFYALRNIKGTTLIKDISVGNDQEELATYATKWVIDGESRNCLTSFIYVGGTNQLAIGVLDLTTNDFYTPFIETQPDDYDSEDRVVDAKGYSENGVDYLYFTDFYNEIRHVRCEDPGTTISNYDISLLRKGANGTIELTSIGPTGGTLLSGTYQFAYRMVNPDTKKFTKWSSLTNPIHIYNQANSATTPTYSGIGVSTTEKITLSITPSTEETDNFEYLQLAVVENVGPTIQDIDGVTTALPTTASLLEITAIPGTSLTFEYKSNSRIGTVELADITVDLAQIKTAKTLNVKENRLVLGNIKYFPLEFDNGTPTVTSGSITSTTVASKDAYSSDDFASRYVGYWRDEVYRFGIVYYDEYGNKSAVQPLDLTGKITGNQSSGVDVKFPSRATTGAAYTLMNASNEIKALGLTLTGIVNHPTWARSFEIVRVKRIKNILFQSPLIPMVKIYGVGANGNYPSVYTGESGDNTVDDAQPQTSGYTLAPKNMFVPDLRFIDRHNTGVSSGSEANTIQAGEVRYMDSESTYQFSQLFPAPSLYGDTPFVFTGGEKIDFVDYALLKADVDELTATTSGDDINTNIGGNFYAINQGQYYFDAAHSGKSIPVEKQNVPITGYEYFDNFGEPASLNGVSVMDYSALETSGVDWGFKPTIQRCAVVNLGGGIIDYVNDSSKTFASGTLSAYSAGGTITTGGLTYESTKSNRFINEYSGYANNSSFVGAIDIVNVKLGLGDDRYGDINAFHEYISTGAKYTFSSAEVATLESGGSVSKNITVYGGDCFVGSHLFKVSDSTYSIVNNGKNSSAPDGLADLLDKWKIVYKNLGSDAAWLPDAFMCIPVALEGAAQYVQLILESDYSEVRDTDTIGVATNSLNVPIFNNNSKESLRVPLSYKYNLNLSKQNAQKVFVPKPLYSFSQNDFAARLAYSDLKIYNSDQAGFDIFRVGNIYDLEETRGAITKLAITADKLIAIQKSGVVYVPTGERQLETTSAGTLAVRSGDFIGRPIIIDSVRGSQHLRGIVETGNVIFIPDNQNKSIYALSGTELVPIIENNETQFRTFFASILEERDVVGIYNPQRKEYWIVDKSNNNCEVFNEGKGWIGEYDFTGLKNGVFTNQNLYVIGCPSTTSTVATMYTGTVNQLFGETVVPSVTFVVNPDEEAPKVFDDVCVVASERLSTIDLVIERETALGNQTCATTSLDSTSIEGNFRIKTPRDGDGGRLRGLRMTATIKFKAIQSALRSVLTKYRHSSRSPF